MLRISRSFTKHASLKSRGLIGAALPRRRCQATAAGSSFASTSARTLETPNHHPHAYSLPAPIHSDFRQTSLSQHRFFPASSTVEQLALLEICLATGNLVRARKVFNSIRTLYLEESRYLDEHSATATYDELDPSSGQWQRRLKFQDVVPVAIHTQFLRAFFRQAVVQQNTNYVTRGAWLSKKALVSEAWEWFEMLLNDEQNYGQLDDGAWAVMLKGLVA
jgi:DNA-directed RNA polymerase